MAAMSGSGNLPGSFKLGAVQGVENRKVDPDIFRTLRLCCPHFASRGPATFRPPNGRMLKSWLHWVDVIFIPVVLPAFRSALRHASKDHPDEVRLCDEFIDRRIGCGRARSSSRGEGRRLLREYIPPARARVLERFRIWAQDEVVPGHFPIVFAVRCATFHIPAQLAVASYLFQEWQAATGEEHLLPLLSLVHSWLDAGCDELDLAALTSAGGGLEG
jgi:hypothetical protein